MWPPIIYLRMKASIISKLLLSKSFFWLKFKWLHRFNNRARVFGTGNPTALNGPKGWFSKRPLIFSEVFQFFSALNWILVYWQRIQVSYRLLYISWVYMLDTCGANTGPFRNYRRAFIRDPREIIYRHHRELTVVSRALTCI